MRVLISAVEAVPAFPCFTLIHLCQSPRCGPEQRRDGNIYRQSTRVPRQYSAQLERRLLGGHVCREAQPWLLHAGLPVPETLDQKTHLQGKRAIEGRDLNWSLHRKPLGFFRFVSNSAVFWSLTRFPTQCELPVYLLPFLTFSWFSTAFQSRGADEVRSSLQFGGRGARRRHLHPQFPRPQRSGGSLRQRGPRARWESVHRFLPLAVHRQTGPEQGLTITDLVSMKCQVRLLKQVW